MIKIFEIRHRGWGRVVKVVAQSYTNAVEFLMWPKNMVELISETKVLGVIIETQETSKGSTDYYGTVQKSRAETSKTQDGNYRTLGQREDLRSIEFGDGLETIGIFRPNCID